MYSPFRLSMEPLSFNCLYCVFSSAFVFFLFAASAIFSCCNDNDDEKKMMLDCTTEKKHRPAIKTKQTHYGI